MAFTPTFDPSRWASGFKAGMFDKNSPVKAFGITGDLPVPGATVAQPAPQGFFDSEAFKGLDPGLKGTLGYIEYVRQQAGKDRPQEYRDFLEAQRIAAIEAQKLGKESLGEAAKYKMLMNLPSQMMTALTLPGTLAAEGANRVATTIAEGMRAMPGPVVTARNPTYQPTQYYGRMG